MHATAEDAHLWLHRLAGRWTYETEMTLEPGQAPQTFAGTETGRLIGDCWVQLEGEGETPGGRGVTLMTLGYDPRRACYVGSWIGSMSPQMWVYEGEMNDEGTVLTLSCDGPDMADPSRTARYRDVIELDGNDRRLLSAFVQDAAGAWQPLVSVRYLRAGA